MAEEVEGLRVHVEGRCDWCLQVGDKICTTLEEAAYCERNDELPVEQPPRGILPDNQEYV